MRRILIRSASRCASTCLFLLLAGAGTAGAQAVPLRPGALDGLRFREIGPAVIGGRIHDIQGVPGDPTILYVASASGGLWKTTNKGTTWTAVFDDQAVSTFGVVAVSPSNPQIVWVGTGEQNNRQSSSWGNGVYRSTDAARTWTHVGLDDTRSIGKIEVHPQNPDIAYVAALGNLWSPSPDRGVFKTTDGGRTWQKVLFVDTLTGVVDLVMDPSDPNTLYAAAYQRLRTIYGYNGGGPGSGILKTTDGGRTWRRLANGLPAGDKGRIGLAIARSNPRVLNAMVEARDEDQGVYRSEDGGESWVKVYDKNERPSYYSGIIIDPQNDARVYALSMDRNSFKSEDGGRTWETIATPPTYDVGVKIDHHALWIDPADTRHMYLGTDGGLYESWDRGVLFTKLDNLPISQYTAIGVDMRDPYYIYGGTQDNHDWMAPSATRHWSGILRDDWTQIEFGDGMYAQPDPTNHKFIYRNSSGGRLTRVDAETGDTQDLTPYPPRGERPYRFDWLAPTVLSRHDPATLYLGGNRLFISRDRGYSWQRTEDLTRQIDPDTLRIMGVPRRNITLSRNDGTSNYGEIVTIAESPLDPNILWVGVDDGNIQVSRDGAKTWTEVSRNVRGIRDGEKVSRIIASASGPGVAYATFDAHERGEFSPYVFRTRDFGRTWEPLMAGLPSGSVNVILEHPKNPNVLFLGTEHALFASADAGASWVKVKAGLPTTIYRDIVIHPREGDLIVATHGRGIWILDDAAPLGEWSSDPARAAAQLFAIRPATLFQFRKDDMYRGNHEFLGENPPFGAIVTYSLGAEAPSARVTVANSQGTVVRTLQGPGRAGFNRVVWDLRHEPPPYEPELDFVEVNDATALGPAGVLPQPVLPRGPFVSPGTYRVTLEAGGTRLTQDVVVEQDPLMPRVAQRESEERERFTVGLLGLQRQAFDAYKRAQALNARGEARELFGRVSGLLRSIYGLADQFNGNGVRPGTLHPPTSTQQQRYADLERTLREVLDSF